MLIESEFIDLEDAPLQLRAERVFRELNVPTDVQPTFLEQIGERFGSSGELTWLDSSPPPGEPVMLDRCEIMPALEDAVIEGAWKLAMAKEGEHLVYEQLREAGILSRRPKRMR